MASLAAGLPLNPVGPVPEPAAPPANPPEDGPGAAAAALRPLRGSQISPGDLRLLTQARVRQTEAWPDDVGESVTGCFTTIFVFLYSCFFPYLFLYFFGLSRVFVDVACVLSNII